MFALSISRTTLYWLCACAIIAIVFYIVGQVDATPRTTRATAANNIASCVSQDLAEALKRNPALPPEEKTRAFIVCRDVMFATLLADEHIIRNETLVLQRDQNAAMLTLVVIITVSGVVLAGLQLLGSFYIAKEGRAAASDAGEFSVKSTEISVKSSYVGVLILGLSLVFFAVFVLFVYRLDQLGDSGHPTSTAGRNIGIMNSGTSPQTP